MSTQPSFAPNPDQTAAQLRVLVVDDDDDSREMLQQALARIGYPSTGVRDGEAAWREHRELPADVILSHWSAGVELCGLVRAQASTGYTYFVFMTGFGDKAHFLEGMRAGADDYLTKPVDIEELEARLLSASRVVSMQRTLVTRNARLRHESDASFEAAHIDTLTFSANRLRLREDLDALQSRAARYGHRYCAAVCDIDFFKAFNDTYGHLAGDDALRSVAGTMGRALRQGDTLYRYGGEEFLVILLEQTIDEARGVMDRVRTEVEDLAIPQRRSEGGVLTISVGIAELGETSGSCEDWLCRADAALYRAKHGGRNRVEIDEGSFDACSGVPPGSRPPRGA